MDAKKHDIFMNAAIEEAKLSLSEGGIPIGAVLVKNDKILGKGHNRRLQDGNPIGHAEIICLRNAGRLVDYHNTKLYSTLMPCYLCAGAVVQFKIKKVVVGESQNFTGAEDFMKQHGVRVINLNLLECKKMMKKFINENPDIWKEDIGN